MKPLGGSMPGAGDTMASTYIECAVQCGKELREDNRKSFEECLAKQECEEFQECSDAL